MKISSYIESMRPQTWFLAGVPLIFMSILAADFNITFSVITTTISLFLIAVVFVLGGTNMFNEAFDMEADKHNKPHRPIVSNRITRESAIYLSFLLFALALMWSSFLSNGLFYLTLMAIFLGIIYSVPKIRAKDKPLSPMFILAAGYGFLIPISPWTVFGPGKILIGILITTISYVWFLGTTNFKDFKDIRGDKIKGTENLLIKTGAKRTITIMIILMSIIPSLILGFYIYNNIFPLWSSLAFISFIATFILLYKIMRKYSPQLAHIGYNITYILYPSIFVFLTIGFWLGV